MHVLNAKNTILKDLGSNKLLCLSESVAIFSFYFRCFVYHMVRHIDLFRFPFFVL